MVLDFYPLNRDITGDTILIMQQKIWFTTASQPEKAMDSIYINFDAKATTLFLAKDLSQTFQMLTSMTVNWI